ncbi:acylneuraminate cytidylyltransferase [Hyphomonas adhaerens]|uniref:acylneuraminate cytidylyltransferase n=1 Tax=Hyphomonas adhaerens TaxID=81029 RepID=UPI0023529B98|nr:acylneuraminate cytidylyltransferase [Hyphomonas adhaerens]
MAIIPARGGSKGVPGKNLKPIGGRSLLRRAIEAAAGSPHIAEVYVTSDDDRILEEARRYGAKAIRRPDDLSTDTASSEAALLHAIAEIEDGGRAIDKIVFIQCTSPFIQTRDIDGLFDAMAAENADCALTVTPFHGFLWKPGEEGAEAVGHDKHVRPRRQDREPVFLETGAAYLMKVGPFKDVKHRFYGRVAQHVMEPVRSVEIDEPLDLLLAEQTAADIEGKAELRKLLPSPVEALLLDFDGVMTDDLAIVSEDGTEAVSVSRADGMGLERLRKLTSIKVAVVSKESNKVVAARCKKLGIPCAHGVEDKPSTIRKWAEEAGVDLARSVFVGNDYNDLPVFPLVGLAVTPGDARGDVRSQAGLVLEAAGGRGAVREICEILIENEKNGEAS